MIPLTVICGYLGSGKTTLINNILQSTKKPIGVLVNDFGELNIDEQLILNQDDLTIALTNGCVCCNLNVVFCLWLVCEDYSDSVRRTQCDILMLCMF